MKPLKVYGTLIYTDMNVMLINPYHFSFFNTEIYFSAKAFAAVAYKSLSK